MTIARDRLRLLDFKPLDCEHETAVQLDALIARFAVNDAGHIVKLYFRDTFRDEHTNLALSLSHLASCTAGNHPASPTGISDLGMTELLSHPMLEEVLYQGNQSLTGTFFSTLTPNSSVKRIGVPFCPIDDDGLAFARGCALTHISLRGSQVSDASIDVLATMHSLMQIHVKQTEVTRPGAERLHRLLPNCWIDMIHRPQDR